MAINTTSVAHIRLTVTDIERSRRFYESVFGWPVTLEMPEEPTRPPASNCGSCSAASSTTSAAIRSRPAAGCSRHVRRGPDRPRPSGVPCREQGRTGFEAAEHLDDLGIPHEAVKDIGMMYILEFRDPDNIALELTAPKVISSRVHAERRLARRSIRSALRGSPLWYAPWTVPKNSGTVASPANASLLVHRFGEGLHVVGARTDGDEAVGAARVWVRGPPGDERSGRSSARSSAVTTWATASSSESASRSRASRPPLKPTSSGASANVVAVDQHRHRLVADRQGR